MKVRITEYELAHSSAAMKLLRKKAERNAYGFPLTLNDDPIRLRRTAEEASETDHTLLTDEGNFDERPTIGYVDDGDDPARRKQHVAEAIVIFGDGLPIWQRNFFSACREARPIPGVEV